MTYVRPDSATEWESPGCELANWSRSNPRRSESTTASASPSAIVAIVDAVGATLSCTGEHISAQCQGPLSPSAPTFAGCNPGASRGGGRSRPVVVELLMCADWNANIAGLRGRAGREPGQGSGTQQANAGRLCAGCRRTRASGESGDRVIAIVMAPLCLKPCAAWITCSGWRSAPTQLERASTSLASPGRQTHLWSTA